jgi:hypothetical protein
VPEFPDWTEFCSDESEHRGLDPLGLESVGASIVQKRLLPGITNATRHIRYYPFFCWVFWNFWNHKSEKALLSGQRRWRTRFENILRSATLDKDENIQGLVGVTKATRIKGKPAKAQLIVEGGHAASAFVPVNYSSSFRALGCGLWEDKKGAKLTEFGTSLALAFDRSLNDLPGSRSALKELCSDAAEVSVGAIRAVAEGIRLRQVGPGEPEHKLLLELLLRMDADDHRVNADFDQSRSSSFALFMEITEQAEGTLSSPSDLYRIFATGQLPNHHAFAVPPELQHRFEIWKRYQERQYIKLSIYALWHEVVQTLAYTTFKTAPAQQLLSHFNTSLKRSELARKWLGKEFASQTVADVLQALSKQLGLKPRDFGDKAIGLAEILMDLERASDDRVSAAVVLLFLCTCYWKSNGNVLAESYLHKQGGTERLSLEAVCNDLEQLSDSTVAEYLQWAVETYVLKQSTRVAVQKLPDYRFFIIRDDQGYRLVKSQSPRSYLSYDSSRIGSAYELMSGLKLIDMKNGIKLTAAGRKVLQKLRSHHQLLQSQAAQAARA